ncbi:MAG: ABC transporter permease [Hyphomicrobiaceae bacterium]|nr:ABC transporter permease [Hyphomicrobiaceae bacterium]
MPRALAILARRLLSAVPVVLIVALGGFLLVEAAPGDAVDAYVASAGGDATMAAELRRAWGLEGGVIGRLLAYGTALAHFDLGRSLALSRPVLDVVMERLPNTLMLMAAALSLSFSFGSLLGIVAGARPGSWRDRLLSMLSLAVYAIPSFWLGLVLAIVFAVNLRWLPLSGIETMASGKSGWARAVDIGRHLVLPVAALGLIYTALYLRVMRSAMAEIWRADFIRACRARGLAPRRILFAHVARNALLPLVTLLGVQAAAMLGGSVVIESIFAIPGLGRLAQEAVAGRDAPLLVGIILVSSVCVIAVNLAVDVIAAALDPRIGSGSERAA